MPSKRPPRVEVIDARDVPAAQLVGPPPQLDALDALARSWRAEGAKLRKAGDAASRDLFELAAVLLTGATAIIRADALDDCAEELEALAREWRARR